MCDRYAIWEAARSKYNMALPAIKVYAAYA